MKMWLGYNSNKTMEFKLSNDYLRWNRMDDEGNKYGKVPAISWFTNMNTTKRYEDLILYKKYNVEDYPKYDNYDAINIDKVIDIPIDYKGVMGVPITFMNKYNPEQFEILGIDRYIKDNPNYGKRFTINGKEKYARILIKRIQFEIVDCCEPCIDLNILKQNPKFKEYKSRQLIHEGKVCQKTYHRILIKRIEKVNI